MKFKKLGQTDIDVSLICLGTMTWGEQNTPEEAYEQLDYAFDQGINFIDTAEMYPVPPKAETYTDTETIIGKWNKLHGQRDKIILATKVAGPMESGYIRGGNDLSSRHIKEALEGSLKRLKTDYVDLYQLHWPDRLTNFFGVRGFQNLNDEKFTPFMETLETLDVLVKEGKIRHVGISNETPWGAMNYLNLAKAHNLPRMVSIQNPYSLLNRTFEVGLSEIALRENLGLLAYSPLGFGVLSGKYLGGASPQGARLTLFSRFSRYSNPQATKATEMYCDLAKDLGMSPAQLALAFVNSRSFMTSNIIGATNMNQLKENICSIEVELSPEALERIEAIHELIPNPSP